MDQREVWNSIAQPWRKFKENQKPLQEVVDFLRGKRGKTLDLGCGSGRNFQHIGGEIYGVDFSEKMLKLAGETAEGLKKKASLTLSEADSLPFKSNFFDNALFIATLHCLEGEKRKKSLEELHRVLKRGGKALITVWSRNSKRVKNRPKGSMIPWTVKGKKYFRYYYIYDLNELKKLLNEVGFKIIELKENKNIIAIVEKIR